MYHASPKRCRKESPTLLDLNQDRMNSDLIQVFPVLPENRLTAVWSYRDDRNFLVQQFLDF